MSTLFVRHGTTEWNEAARIQGWAPVGLSDRGREEAEAVADDLAGRHAIDAVVASDLARTVETAEPIAAAAGVELETDPRLRERDFGVFQGLPSGDFFERFPDFDLLESGRAAAERAPESGESWLAVRDRVLDAAADLRAREGTVVAVTHVNPIRLVVGERRDLPVVRSLTELSADNCSVTEVDGGGAVVRANDRSYK
ncbi:histidine phosphatase family protein [Halorubrum rutilum]|uniref:Histidine phosphatase family protein n=1 Tax=Halorubrum rutilum TaxID=1364933 RepID=A0ABD6APW1_9EURY|nr:histidine phosphatase family protein [Halorubrum rutilum]